MLTVRRVLAAFQTLHDTHAQPHFAAADFTDAATPPAARIGMLPGAQSRRL